MQKKLKAGQYKNKKQFNHDLNLIWDNCLLYNSDPSHPLRRNVQFMRKKANHLLEFISDKSDVKDVLVQWGISERTTASITEPNGTADAQDAPSQPQGQDDSSENPTPSEPSTFDQQQAYIRTSETMTLFAKMDTALAQLDAKIIGDWQAAGPSSRPKSSTQTLVKQMDDIKVKSDLNPLTSTLAPIFRPYGKGKERSTDDSTAATDTVPATNLDTSAEWFTVVGSHDLMCGSLPALRTSEMTPVETASASTKRKKSYHLVPATMRKGLRGKVARNIRTIQRLQETHNKFLSLAHYVENEAPIPHYLTSMSSDEESDYPSDVEDDAHVRIEPARHPLARITTETVREHMSYNAQTVLAHQGFEGCHRVAADVMTDVMGEFLMNMGRILRIYTDRYANKMSPEELILHTLQESGGLDVLGLENYVRNDVERYGSKMGDLLRKLRQSYREHFNLSTERGVIEDDALFADGGEALVAGNFAEDLGDDYFGFRELGLDRELGISGLTVPTRLFYGRPRNGNAASAAARNGAIKENVLPYPPPAPPIALTSGSISVQIGLMQTFYQDKMREHRQRSKQHQAHLVQQREQAATPLEQADGLQGSDAEQAEQPLSKDDAIIAANTLEDEEQEKQRYKVPPTGKMPRRQLWSPALARRIAEAAAAGDTSDPPHAAAAAGTGPFPKIKTSTATNKEAKHRKRQEGITA